MSLIIYPFGTSRPIFFKTFFDWNSFIVRVFLSGHFSHMIDRMLCFFHILLTSRNAPNAPRLLSSPVNGIIACLNRSFANSSGKFSSSDVIKPTGHLALFFASFIAAIAGSQAFVVHRPRFGRSIIINKKSYRTSVIHLKACCNFT